MSNQNDPLEHLMDYINTIQESLVKMNQTIVDVNTQHESLKGDVQQNLNTDITDSLSGQIDSMTQSINHHMQQAEEMLAHSLDEERLKYMANMTLLQNQMIKGKK